mgnify:CR=1 FL=1
MKTTAKRSFVLLFLVGAIITGLIVIAAVYADVSARRRKN